MESIIKEAGIALARTSGSDVTYGSREFTESFYTADGRFLLTGGGILLHVYGIANLVKYILNNYEKNIGIHEGDQFLFSDPYLAGMHVPDQIMITPIVYEGRRFGFCASLTHVPEVGSIDPGGFCPRATEVYHEGVRLRGLRIMNKGQRCEDAIQSIRAMVRLPDLVELDIMSKVACNNVIVRRMQDLIRKYGFDTMIAFGDEIIDYSERVAKQRLSSMADGIWKSVTYLDHDGVENRIYRLVLTATKEGDNLTFDWTGSAAQAPSFVNAAIGAAMGCSFAVLAARLFYDVPWNEGIIRPIKIVAPQGTIINPEYPAPVSGGMPSGAGVCAFAVQDVLNKMFLASGDSFRAEVSGTFGWSVHAVLFHGVNQYRDLFAWLPLHEILGGMGARTFSDGVSTALSIQSPKARIQNVEDMELRYPVLFLYRRQKKNSGGPGTFRGGLGGEFCVFVRDSPIGMINLVSFQAGVEPALATGLAGGLPASNAISRIIRHSNLAELFAAGTIPKEVTEISGKVEEVPTKGIVSLSENDVLINSWHGGGGFGDPLDRAPELVLQDLNEELITEQVAEKVYGVVFDAAKSKVNTGATVEMRTSLRKNRLLTAKFPAS